MKKLGLGLVAACALAVACSSSNEATTTSGPAASSSSGAGGTMSSSSSSAGAGGGGGANGEAVATFYADIHASKYSRAETDALALDDEAMASPDAAEVALARGLAHLWHMAEFGRDQTQDPSKLTAEGIGLLTEFQTAQKLAPNDPRIPCWLGLTLITAGTQTQNQMFIDQGRATIEQGVAAYPQFNLFCRALAYADLPAADPDFAKAADALWQNLDVCFGEMVDRMNPDITPYLGQETDQGPNRVCWNDPITPHGAEGFYLFFGDVLVKKGDVELAKIAYNDAKLVTGYASWPFKSVLESRLSGDLNARAALYQDADPKNDPPLGGNETYHGCTYCHASSAAE